VLVTEATFGTSNEMRAFRQRHLAHMVQAAQLGRATSKLKSGESANLRGCGRRRRKLRLCVFHCDRKMRSSMVGSSATGGRPASVGEKALALWQQFTPSLARDGP